MFPMKGKHDILSSCQLEHTLLSSLSTPFLILPTSTVMHLLRLNVNAIASVKPTLPVTTPAWEGLNRIFSEYN